MKVLFICPSEDPTAWIDELTALAPALEFSIWPELENTEDIDVALAWNPPHGELRRFPHLELIINLGMGIDHLFKDPALPNVKLARVADSNLIDQMSEYVCLETLRFHRRSADYESFQREHRWQRLPPPDTRQCTVGILGLGTIGSDIARKLHLLGFPVVGWSRTRKMLSGVESFQGDGELRPFLARSKVLACLLPLTPATCGIINAETLALLPNGAYVINCARGGHVIEKDLLAALDNGHIAGATLDVFQQEPLPPEHPFWDHPKVRITPHSAGLFEPRSIAPQLIENIRRVRANEAVLNPIDRRLGY